MRGKDSTRRVLPTVGRCWAEYRASLRQRERGWSHAGHASRPAMWIALSGILCGGVAWGQSVVCASGPVPSFEVATIKPVHQGEALPPLPPPSPNMFRSYGGSARDLVRIAYGLPPGRASDRVFGGPGWIDSNRYDVEGKISDACFAAMQKLPAQERSKKTALMLQLLLADRFKLVAHLETREMPIYGLTLAKGGPKLTLAKPVVSGDDAPSPPIEAGAMPKPADMRQGLIVLRKAPGVMEMTAKGQTLEALAQQPFFGLGSPVVNKTGLTDKYDFVLDWSPDRGATAETADGQMELAPTLTTALAEQLGLKLVLTKGQVEVVVIDHIEMPTPN